MREFLTTSWSLVMDNRFNPLRHLDLASQHYFMQVLAWMWSMVFSLSFLSIFHFHLLWFGHLLLVAGVFITVAVFSKAEATAKTQESGSELSHGSVCVWQLDREA
ncbi:hypothetical protein FKG94_13000 [Exilibacterium tricleocarpae]|uniref:Uncharacterized protein n=1 Tax=Exilibacterium tricleocarpae TaxID=2591008 RepID=A0A545TNY4_9GAMM|nr:hypothetical protein [Exilibacterium tricleocarpae]TQV78926.1 hypothetical protein FKG94_13000 [Exilibacterium tricleocarpae]